MCRCYICDKELSDRETSWNEDIDGLEPCGFCLDIIYEAAFSDGFEKEEGDVVEVLDSSFDDLYFLPVSVTPVSTE